MDKKTASWFAYLLSALSAIIVLVTEKQDKEVRTHAWQSLFLSCAAYVVVIVLTIIRAIAVPNTLGAYVYGGGWGAFVLFSWIIGLVWLAYGVVAIICIVKAVQGGIFKIPVIYNQAIKMK